MKIINGHDYYDNAGYGVDPSIMFLRENKIIEVPDSLIERYRINRRAGWGRACYIIVAGKVYPAVVTTRKKESQYHTTYEHYEYNKELALGYRNYDRYDVENITSHYDEIPAGWEEWLIKNKVVTGWLQSVFNHHTHKTEIKLLSNISTLGEFNFYNVMDASTAHMEISRYVGGVLSNNPTMVKLSDKSKINKAGFDYVNSFRSAPTKKRKRK